MKHDLRIKQFPNNRFACGGFFPLPEHLPATAIRAKRQKVRPGEIFSVNTKEQAKFYLNTGLIEIVL